MFSKAGVMKLTRQVCHTINIVQWLITTPVLLLESLLQTYIQVVQLGVQLVLNIIFLNIPICIFKDVILPQP